MRLFTAISIPQDLSDRLTGLQRGVPGASWRPVENFHITLRFFGDVAGGLARDLDDEISRISARPFQISLDGAGWFGRREPDALWVGVTPCAELSDLAGECERAARRLGLPPERRQYRPHVTLAYCHAVSLTDASAFAERNAAFRSEPFWVDMFHLYSSHLGKGPSRYTPLADYPLA